MKMRTVIIWMVVIVVFVIAVFVGKYLIERIQQYITKRTKQEIMNSINPVKIVPNVFGGLFQKNSMNTSQPPLPTLQAQLEQFVDQKKMIKNKYNIPGYTTIMVNKPLSQHVEKKISSVVKLEHLLE
jgi:predicted PurR-regulated permease PerM